MVTCGYCWFVGPRRLPRWCIRRYQRWASYRLSSFDRWPTTSANWDPRWASTGRDAHKKEMDWAFLGVWMVVSEKLPEENSFGMDSIFFASLALFSITFGTLYQKRFATKLDIRTGAVIQFISALTIFGLLSFSLETMVVEWTFESIFALFWLALVLSIGAILILMRLIQSGAASNVASLFYLVPPATAVEAWWLFDEKLGWLAIVGMLVAVLGVAMVVQRPQSQSKASEG